MKGNIRSSVAALGLLASACASHPAIWLAREGTLPAGGAFAYGAADTEPVPEEALVTARLREHGFTPGASPAYLVQVSHSTRGAKAGLFLPDAPPGTDGKRAWLMPPAGGSTRRLDSFAVSFTDTASGREVYRISGTERYRPARAGASPSRLAEAVLAQLPAR